MYLENVARMQKAYQKRRKHFLTCDIAFHRTDNVETKTAAYL